MTRYEIMEALEILMAYHIERANVLRRLGAKENFAKLMYHDKVFDILYKEWKRISES